MYQNNSTKLLIIFQESNVYNSTKQNKKIKLSINKVKLIYNSRLPLDN